MVSRKSVGARQLPGQSVCSHEAFATFLDDLLDQSFLGFAPDNRKAERCREQLLYALEVYRAAKSYDANYILQEMREVHQVASQDLAEPADYSKRPMSEPACKYRENAEKQYHATCKRVEVLSMHSRNNLIQRLRNRPCCTSAVEVDQGSLLPTHAQCNGIVSVLPNTLRAYCQLIASLSRIGMKYARDDDGKSKDGRRRPSGNRSRTPLVVELFGPDPQPQPRRKGAEREFEALLAFAWWELTGDASRKDKRYVTFVQSLLKQVGSKGTDVDFLVSDARRQADRARKKSAEPSKKTPCQGGVSTMNRQGLG